MVEGLKPGRGGLSPSGGLRRALRGPPSAAVLLACAAVLALRREGALSNPQFWAEDGHFYERAYVMGWRCLTLPYAGYLHAVPRAVAVLAASVDPALAPAVFVGFAALLTLYVASQALSPRCPLPRAAGVFALAVVLVPDTYEVLLNVVNLQWVLAGGLVLLLVSRDPSGRGQWTHDLCAAAALGLTGPFSVILAPLFIWRAWERRTKSSAVLAAVVSSCGLLQALCLHYQPPSDPGTPGDWSAALLVLPAVARRIGGSLLLGSLLPETAGTVLGTVGGLATLLGVGFLALRPRPARGRAPDASTCVPRHPRRLAPEDPLDPPRVLHAAFQLALHVRAAADRPVAPAPGRVPGRATGKARRRAGPLVPEREPAAPSGAGIHRPPLVPLRARH